MFTPIVRLLRVADSSAPSSLCFIFGLAKSATAIVKTPAITPRLTLVQRLALSNLWDANAKRFSCPLARVAAALNPKERCQKGPMPVDLYDAVFTEVTRVFLYGPGGGFVRRSTAMEEIRDFTNGIGRFAGDQFPVTAETYNAHEFWCYAQVAAPTIYTWAARICGMAASASPCERIWASYDYVVSKRRVRMGTAKSNQAVHLRASLQQRTSHHTSSDTLRALLADAEGDDAANVVADLNDADNVDDLDDIGANNFPQEELDIMPMHAFALELGQHNHEQAAAAALGNVHQDDAVPNDYDYE